MHGMIKPVVPLTPSASESTFSPKSSATKSTKSYSSTQNNQRHVTSATPNRNRHSVINSENHQVSGNARSNRYRYYNKDMDTPSQLTGQLPIIPLKIQNSNTESLDLEGGKLITTTDYDYASEEEQPEHPKIKDRQTKEHNLNKAIKSLKDLNSPGKSITIPKISSLENIPATVPASGIAFDNIKAHSHAASQKIAEDLLKQELASLHCKIVVLVFVLLLLGNLGWRLKRKFGGVARGEKRGRGRERVGDEGRTVDLETGEVGPVGEGEGEGVWGKSKKG